MEEVAKGIAKIQKYVLDFDYDNLKNKVFSVEGIKNLYLNESNAYFKVQLFRVICELADSNKLRISSLDQGWYKFIDETYHIDNDYLHYLDVSKFNIVPSYISEKVDEMMKAL